MYLEQITLLLSNHRNSDRPEVPTTLSKTQIVSLIGSSLSPNESQDDLTTKVGEALKELEAIGDINGGSRNRYCVAPPTVLAAASDNLTGLLFRGDRAYLSLAHQALNTQQEHTEIKLKPNISNFEVIKNKLSQVGIALLIVDESIESLPVPQLPSKAILRSPCSLNPFENAVLQYLPNSNFATQAERWQAIVRSQLSNKSLLQLVTGEYLWFEDNSFYELERDRATLIMFALDREKEYLLRIPWNKSEGKLHLKGVSLPAAYARWLWSLSDPVSDSYRTRFIKPEHRPLVESAFERLGCLLV